MCDYSDCNLRNIICDYLIDELGADASEIEDYDDDELLDEIRDFINWLCREVTKKERRVGRLEEKLLLRVCPDRDMGRDDEYDDLDCEADE